ncbi:acyl carrier protein [Ruminiclostridium sufflavum DSM 19573]|uniref:Acyl carrier protein n=1 Tax=Ruminiclostridium sufflavum DSM 19573 TaxID=1121337 RepID=A0A318XJN1_9FIRM|nr:peptide maturation system acyl carrier-related protein [Ruminiclostridium sufflavum]PYG84362.1 acyl carrier protein [Ruminiclostridium sufflavum DSM 19573]
MNNKVYEGLQKIFCKRFNIELESLNTIKLDNNLLGKEWCLEPRDLLYLFFDIENEFGIKIPEDVIEDGRFSSISNIADIISDIIANRVA